MKDNWGDEITVSAEERDSAVYVKFEVYGRVADMDLSPKKARKFAKRLKRAADAVEGRQ